jgi:hypothetical protein
MDNNLTPNTAKETADDEEENQVKLSTEFTDIEIHSTEDAAISIIEKYKVVIDENYKKKAKKITYKKLKL